MKNDSSLSLVFTEIKLAQQIYDLNIFLKVDFLRVRNPVHPIFLILPGDSIEPVTLGLQIGILIF
jgi:hypothetical protein